jgi:cytochrome oxidase Cu insertion factor (SCO1/SenC/PrrC family)
MIRCALALLLVFSVFSLGSAVADAQPQRSEGAPKVGERAPDFTLPDSTGKRFTLSKVFAEDKDVANVPNHPTWVLLIFYRGYW